MGIRDSEIERLKKYAQGLDLKVIFKQAKPYNTESGDWTTDGTELRVIMWKGQSKINTILTMIHELSHHLQFIHVQNRKVNVALDNALDNDEIRSKRERVYKFEIESYKWWETIYKDTNMKFDINLLLIERKLDTWIYKHYVKTGEFPSIRATRRQMKLIKKRHKYRK